jgi:hypothetical protein
MNYFIQAVDPAGNVSVALDHSSFYQVDTPNAPPTAAAGPNQNASEGSLVTFNGSYSDPNPLDTHTLRWQVAADNGQQVPDGTMDDFSFTPNDNGTYMVSLTVTDTHGADHTDTAVLTVTNLPPITEAGPDQTVNEGQQADFVGSFTDPGSNDTHTLEWEVVDSGGGTVATGSGLNFSFTPDDNDTFTVTFTVTDDDGGVGSTDVPLTSLNVPPTADAGPDQTGGANQPVTFTGTYTDPGTADTHTFLWQVEASNGQNVPDGTGQDFTFTPNAGGTYTLTFTVTDDDGGVGMDTAVLVVEEEVVVYRLYMPVVQRAGPVTQSTPLSYGEQFGKLFYLLAVVKVYALKRTRGLPRRVRFFNNP